MDKKKSFSVGDSQEIQNFVDKFTANEYHKKNILEVVEHAKQLTEFSGSVYVEITYSELEGKLYHEHTEIFSGGFSFSFQSYQGEWYYFVGGRKYNTSRPQYHYAPNKEDYKIPKKLKKWNKKKYDSVVEYLKKWRDNLTEAEIEKISKENKRDQITSEIEVALFTKNTTRGDRETVIRGDLATVAIQDGGELDIKLHDYRIKDKMKLLRFIGDLEKTNL